MNINQKNIDGNTALHNSAQEGYLNMAKLFLQNGAITNVQNKNVHKSYFKSTSPVVSCSINFGQDL